MVVEDQVLKRTMVFQVLQTALVLQVVLAVLVLQAVLVVLVVQVVLSGSAALLDSIHCPFPSEKKDPARAEIEPLGPGENFGFS